jgi:predicted RNA binding protein YcfA (HicA-like mRNA interferase family)
VTWPSRKARRVRTALLKIGWQIKRTKGSHRTLPKSGFDDFTFAFHDED